MQFINTLLLLNATMLGAAEEPAVPNEPEVVEPTTPETGDKAPTEKEDDVLTFEDKDKNGIPDVFEDYWEKNIRDEKYFNFGLAAVISTGIAVLPSIYTFFSRRKEKKENKATIDKLVEQNQMILESKQAEKEEYEKELAKRDEEINSLKEKIEDVTNNLKETTQSLENYAQFEKKVDGVLNCLEEISKDRELYKQGISKKVDIILGKVRK